MGILSKKQNLNLGNQLKTNLKKNIFIQMIMNLMELKKSISEKRMNKLYIFTGEEVAILKIYLQKLSGIFNGTVSHVETLSSVASTLKTNSLIQTGPTMYIIRDDKTVLSTEKIWESLKNTRKKDIKRRDAKTQRKNLCDSASLRLTKTKRKE